MPTKKNSSGTQQEYDAKTGQYGSGKQVGEAQRVFEETKRLGIEISKDMNKTKAKLFLKRLNRMMDNNIKEHAKDCIHWTAEEWAKWKEEHDKKEEEYKRRGITWFDDSVEAMIYLGEGGTYGSWKGVD